MGKQTRKSAFETRYSEDGEIIDLEKILLKLTVNSDSGVTYKDVVRYSRCILDNCKKDHTRVLIYGISKDELERVVIDYPDYFFSFNNTFYSSLDNDKLFDRRNSSRVNNLINLSLIDYNENSFEGEVPVDRAMGNGDNGSIRKLEKSGNQQTKKVLYRK